MWKGSLPMLWSSPLQSSSPAVSYCNSYFLFLTLFPPLPPLSFPFVALLLFSLNLLIEWCLWPGGGGGGCGGEGRAVLIAVLLGKLKGAQCSEPAKSRVPSMWFVWKKLRFSSHPRTIIWCQTPLGSAKASPGPTCNAVIACSYSQNREQWSPLGNGQVAYTYRVIAIYRQGFSQKGVQPSHGHPFLEEIQEKFT